MDKRELTALENLAYINLKCMQAKDAGVFDDIEIACLWKALDAIHHILLIQKFPGLGDLGGTPK